MLQRPLLQRQELIEKCILPNLYHHGNKTGISSVMAVKLVNVVVTSVTQDIDVIKMRPYMIPLLFSLCELLHELNLSYIGTSPDSLLADILHKRALVLEVLEKSVTLACDLVEVCTSFTRAVEWLLKRTEEIGKCFVAFAAHWLSHMYQHSRGSPSPPPCSYKRAK